MKLEGSQDGRLILCKDLIEINVKANSREEALIKLSHTFLKQKLVKDTYTTAIIEREKEYPTGLITKSFGVAIPHTDPKHVLKGSIGIGVLKEPVIFKTMDTKENIEVAIIFMLAITKPSAQLKMLQKVIEIIKDENALMKMKESKEKKEILNIVQPFFGNLVTV